MSVGRNCKDYEVLKGCKAVGTALQPIFKMVIEFAFAQNGCYLFSENGDIRLFLRSLDMLYGALVKSLPY